MKTSGLKWALSELGPSLREFALKDFQQWIAGLAGSSLTSVFDHYQKFLTGICTNTAADVQDFINRENIPKGSRLEVPKGFDLPAFMATYANDPSAEIEFASGKVNLQACCRCAIYIEAADAVLSCAEQLSEAMSLKTLGEEIENTPNQPEALRATHCGRVSKIGEALTSIPGSFNVLQKLVETEKVFKKAAVSGLSSITVTRLRMVPLAYGEVLRNCLKQSLSALDLEVDKFVTALHGTINASSDSKLLQELLSKTVNARQSASTEDRIGEPKKFYPALQESASDFLYLCCTKSLLMTNLIATNLDKITQILDHPGLALSALGEPAQVLRASCDGLRSKVASGGMSDFKLVLADLLVPWKKWK